MNRDLRKGGVEARRLCARIAPVHQEEELMRMRRFVISAGAFALAVALATIPAHTQTAAGGGQRGGGGGGRADAPMVGEGTLIAGAWGKDVLPLDPRGWGWMSKSYVTKYKRPFYNKA